jgi:hypothetical protein
MISNVELTLLILENKPENSKTQRLVDVEVDKIRWPAVTQKPYC